MNLVQARAPGRVELLGNHTDYNEGVVLSAAINYAVTAGAESRDQSSIELRSDFYPEPTIVSPDRLVPLQGPAAWTNYPLGVVDCLHKAGYRFGGFNIRFSSDLPPGAGLSSSAAMEVATATLLKKLFSLDLAPMAMAKLCRRAENDFAGVQCGLLDQVSSVFGRAGHAVYLDCRTEEVDRIPLPADTALLVFGSGVTHALTGGEYNERRAQCFAAAAALGVPALRDVSSAQLLAARAALDPTVYRRAAHIVGEDERVFAGVEMLRRGDREGFGALMFASHESSRLNFENSTPELDALVALARDIPGVLGSRLTGGGFGGATITLVERQHAARVAAELGRRYTEQTGNHGHPLLCESADGAA